MLTIRRKNKYFVDNLIQINLQNWAQFEENHPNTFKPNDSRQ